VEEIEILVRSEDAEDADPILSTDMPERSAICIRLQSTVAIGFRLRTAGGFDRYSEFVCRAERNAWISLTQRE
jgi:hypothetical protein